MTWKVLKKDHEEEGDVREKKREEKEEDQTPPEGETGTNLRRSETHPPLADDDVQEGFPHPLRPGVANPIANPVATPAN